MWIFAFLVSYVFCVSNNPYQMHILEQQRHLIGLVLEQENLS